MPWRGLLSRWRFVLPSDYNGVVEWGITKPGEHVVQKGVLRPVEYGPTQLVNGPEVVWFGGHKPLSQTLAAIIVFKHPAPHYLAFGIADQPGGPPLSLEGISFVSDNTHLIQMKLKIRSLPQNMAFNPSVDIINFVYNLPSDLLSIR